MRRQSSSLLTASQSYGSLPSLKGKEGEETEKGLSWRAEREIVTLYGLQERGGKCFSLFLERVFTKVGGGGERREAFGGGEVKLTRPVERETEWCSDLTPGWPPRSGKRFLRLFLNCSLGERGKGGGEEQMGGGGGKGDGIIKFASKQEGV